MKSTILKFLLPMAAIATLAGCTSNDSSDDTPNPQDVSPSWSIENVSYRCSDDSFCPDNQGILMASKRTFVTDDEGNSGVQLSVMRCTATIYNAHQIVTAGHCVDGMKDADEIWFKTAASSTRPSRLFHVTQPATEQIDFSDHFRSDYGSFTLTEAATGIQYAHPALRVSSNYRDMVAMVSNPASGSSASIDTTDFVLNTTHCENLPNVLDHYTFDRNPNMFMVQDCKIFSGNSGGAVVLPNDPLSIVGVVSASNNAKDAGGGGPTLSGMPQDFALFTNMRCASMPGWPLAEPNCLQITENLLNTSFGQTLLATKKR
jgi:V8-like Glu-specific endopeptidase